MVDIANSDSSNIFSSELSDGQFWKKSDTINRIDHNENLVGFIEKFKDKTIAVVGDHFFFDVAPILLHGGYGILLKTDFTQLYKTPFL